MYTIKANSSFEIVIKNSRFICCLYKINNKEDINLILNNVKLKYKDATHYCYAYVCDENIKSSDDGEPGGTAGMPILNVLTSNNLNNIFAVVIRYFGGIKLGTGGLVRAYSKCVGEAIKNNQLVSLIKGINFDIYFDYSKSKDIDYILRNECILSKKFDNEINYNINASNDILYKLENIINSYKINCDVYIEK